MRFFITLSYNGENYVGWQIQPNGLTVQELLQNALSTILCENIKVIGAGRTDTGVHARKMVAHFDWISERFSESQLKRKLNSFLPKDIAIQEIREVQPDAHARFSATSRTYKYYITTEKDAFFHPFKLRLFYPIDMEAMNRLCPILKEYEDFTSFSKLHSASKTNICQIEEAHWEKTGNDYVFTITADRFLRNMVRAIVGTLIEAGRGQLDEQGFRDVIEGKNRHLAGNSAPGHALFLEDVGYPESVWL
ncbi:MAG: tRNA pseudouridine(38-40) synthase TruA [Dysgonamonadaceae bacterium]|jgi:tRNA pseudouridine38-40 synthase|nr:tRNA pseudouridine(38-40) synthase TruA [Dysgonamonadaceae bacterium]